jgi:hypothetical protein
LKNSYAVVLVTVIGVFLAVIKFLAFKGFRNRAEFPGDAPLTVEFLLSSLAFTSPPCRNESPPTAERKCLCHFVLSFPAQATFTGDGSPMKRMIVCTGVTLQKVPDRAFDRTGTNLTYTLLAATITEQ